MLSCVVVTKVSYYVNMYVCIVGELCMCALMLLLLLLLVKERGERESNRQKRKREIKEQLKLSRGSCAWVLVKTSN